MFTLSLKGLLKQTRMHIIKLNSPFKDPKHRALQWLLLFLVLYSPFSLGKLPEHCESWPNWLKPVCVRPYQTWTEGNNELYVTGYAWHNRFKYPKEKIAKYNEAAWGGGAGRGFYDEKGDWHGLYAFAFLESHSVVQPIGGYAFLKTLHINELSSIGLGFTAFITARPDIMNGNPFPGALPWAGLTHRRATFLAIYIPGSNSAGNVLFILGKITL